MQVPVNTNVHFASYAARLLLCGSLEKIIMYRLLQEIVRAHNTLHNKQLAAPKGWGLHVCCGGAAYELLKLSGQIS